MLPFTATIAIGSNIDAYQNIKKAIDLLTQQFEIVATSHFYESKPWPNPKVGHSYINAVISLKTILQPQELLNSLQQIEHHLLRIRPYLNAPRTIDLDIIFIHDVHGEPIILQSQDLTVPHPRYQERSFVLLPLQDIGFQLNEPQQNIVNQDIKNHLIHQYQINHKRY
jgi:2-amino-4-hydroxy-6-hydroxymethyldihydropteridine diphosphokinase